MSGGSAMRQGFPARLPPLWRFAFTAFAGVILFTLAWSQVSRWPAYPAALLAKAGLEQAAPQWVRSVQAPPGRLVAFDSSVAVATAQTGGRLAEISLDAEPGRYAYGLPIFLALMGAATVLQRRSPGRGWRVLAGYALLLPAQAFSLAMYLLMQLVLAAQLDVRVLRIDQGELEAIVYGYQLGVLVLPTLAPVLVWLGLERRFVNDVLVSAWRESLAPVPAAAVQAAVPTPLAVTPAPAPAPEAPVPAAPRRPEISSSAAAVLPPRKP